jgi:putative colanic acid biosynthesis UDP-glucose lipid carrier transferase
MANALSEASLAVDAVPNRPRRLPGLVPDVRRLAVLGHADEHVLRRLTLDRRARIVIGCGTDRPDGVEDLVQRARQRHIDEVVVVPDGQNQGLLAAAVEQLAACPVDISVDLSALATAAAGLACPQVGGQRPVLLVRQPMRGWQAVSKRATDLIGSLVALAILAPLFVLVAIAIKLDSPGPVFFRQARNGLDERPFTVWKFRTMRSGGPDLAVQAVRHDARVTRVGAILRRTSIDELPQLLNVLHGEMSLVGPRPHPVVLDDRFADMLRLYKARHRVLPGMTGLAQINGCRGETDTVEKMEARLRHDLDYIARWSLWLDVKILLATLCGRFLHANAY